MPNYYQPKKQKQVEPPIQKPKTFTISKYYVKSSNANRKISGFGEAPMGVWVEVPERVFNSIKTSVLMYGKAVGWEVKTELIKLEDNK